VTDLEARRWSRFKTGVLVGGLVLALGNGVALARNEHDRRAAQEAAYEECVARNANSVRSRRLLLELANVGDPEERALWKRWLKEIPAGVADCESLR